MKVWLRSPQSLILFLIPLSLVVACNSGSDPEDAIIDQAQVPAVVQQAFLARYPNTQTTWESQPYGYEAVFVKDGIEYEGEFSGEGQWLETEYEVSEMQFPLTVKEQVYRNYPDYAITKYEIELTPSGTFYEVEVERGDVEIELYFNDQANPTQNNHEDA
jgi:hypothetical protein